MQNLLLKIFVVYLLSLLSLPASAAAAKCSDPVALSILKNEVDPIVDDGIQTALPGWKESYEIKESGFYTVSETDDTRDCAAAITLTTQSGLTSDGEVKYRVISTEDGQTKVALFKSFNWQSLLAGIVQDSIRKSRKTQ